MDVEYSKESVKALRKAPDNIAKLVRDKIMQYAADPASLANQVKRLKGVDAYRLRVGDYRVLFDIQIVEGRRAMMTVLKIGPRGDVYDD